MSEKYFPSRKDGHDINVNLNLTGYATKDDLKILNAEINLGHLKDKVDTINDSKRLFETGIAELISATLFNSIGRSIASLRSVNNTEINDCIKNTVLNKIADFVNSIKPELKLNLWLMNFKQILLTLLSEKKADE